MYETYRPKSLKDALTKMSEKNWIPLAGGTDLMIRARNWQGANRNFKGNVLFIGHLEELKRLSFQENYIELGAGLTQRQCEEAEEVPDYLRQVVSLMATPAIRNVASIGGNIANAASVADLMPLFYACDASVKLQSLSHTRILPIDQFILDKYKTARHSDELLISILLPKLQVKRFYYKKVGQRRASILSKVSFVALETGEDMRLAIGAVNKKVIRSKNLEVMMMQKKEIASILDGYKALFDSQNDKRSTKTYREKVAMNLLKRWMEEIR